MFTKAKKVLNYIPLIKPKKNYRVPPSNNYKTKPEAAMVMQVAIVDFVVFMIYTFSLLKYVGRSNVKPKF